VHFSLQTVASEITEISGRVRRLAAVHGLFDSRRVDLSFPRSISLHFVRDPFVIPINPSNEKHLFKSHFSSILIYRDISRDWRNWFSPDPGRRKNHFRNLSLVICKVVKQYLGAELNRSCNFCKTKVNRKKSKKKITHKK